MYGYPDAVISPGFHSRDTSSVSIPIHAVFCLPLGSTKPSFTNARVVTSNSRTVTASSPPSESIRRHRRSAGCAQSAPCHTQLAFSAFASASRSSTVVQTGDAVR